MVALTAFASMQAAFSYPTGSSMSSKAERSHLRGKQTLESGWVVEPREAPVLAQSADGSADGEEVVSHAVGKFPPASPLTVDTVFFDVGNVILNYDYHKAARALSEEWEVPEDIIYDVFVSDEFMIPFETGELVPAAYFKEVKKELVRQGADAEKLKEIDEKRFFEIFSDIYEMKPRTVEIMRQLKDAGYKIYIISNTNPVHKQHVLGAFPEIFSMVEPGGFIASCDIGAMKDDPQIFHEAMKKASIEGQSHRAIFIDDRDDYAEAGRKLGIKSITMQGETDLEHEISVLLREALDRFKRVALGAAYIRHELATQFTSIKGHLLRLAEVPDEVPDSIMQKLMHYNEALVKLIDDISDLFNNIDNRELIDKLVLLKIELEKLSTDEEFIGALRTCGQQLTAEALSESCVRAITILAKFIPYIENNDFSLDLEDVDINKFLGQIAKYRMHNVKYELDFDSQSPVVRTDKNLLEIIIDNLIRNAIEALDSYCSTSGDSAIRERFKFVIITRAQGNKVQVHFEDTGPGIREEDIAHVFDLFWTKDKEGGTGIGLALVKEAVTKLGGEISVESRHINEGHPDDHDTIFTITLPTDASAGGEEVVADASGVRQITFPGKFKLPNAFVIKDNSRTLRIAAFQLPDYIISNGEGRLRRTKEIGKMIMDFKTALEEQQERTPDLILCPEEVENIYVLHAVDRLRYSEEARNRLLEGIKQAEAESIEIIKALAAAENITIGFGGAHIVENNGEFATASVYYVVFPDGHVHTIIKGDPDKSKAIFEVGSVKIGGIICNDMLMSTETLSRNIMYYETIGFVEQILNNEPNLVIVPSSTTSKLAQEFAEILDARGMDRLIINCTNPASEIDEVTESAITEGATAFGRNGKNIYTLKDEAGILMADVGPHTQGRGTAGLVLVGQPASRLLGKTGVIIARDAKIAEKFKQRLIEEKGLRGEDIKTVIMPRESVSDAAVEEVNSEAVSTIMREVETAVENGRVDWVVNCIEAGQQKDLSYALANLLKCAVTTAQDLTEALEDENKWRELEDSI